MKRIAFLLDTIMPNYKKFIDNLEEERYKLSGSATQYRAHNTEFKVTIFDCLLYKFNSDPQRYIDFGIIAHNAGLSPKQ